MNNMCYLHNCVAMIYKDGTLIDKAYTSYNICRNNNIVFKSFDCKNNSCNNHKKIHYYIKNCTSKPINNAQLKINVFFQKETCCRLYNLDKIDPGETICISKEIELNNLTKTKVLSELISCNDIVAKSCIYI